MSGELYFAVGTIGESTRAGRKPSTVTGAARHHKREIQAERGFYGRFDQARSHLNESLAGPADADGVVTLWRRRIDAAGVVLEAHRKDYTQAIELLFSLPAVNSVNEREFFTRCVEWVGNRFGGESLLSADIHRDESAPHCHVLLSPPMVDGRMRGSELVTRQKVAAMNDAFYREVGREFGLKRSTGKRKLSGERKALAVAMVLEWLKNANDGALTSVLWQCIKEDVERDPGPFLVELGIEPPAPKLKTMTQVFTSTGRGPRKERPEVKPIGFDGGVVRRRATREPDSVKPIGFGVDDGRHSAQGTAPVKPIGFQGESLVGMEDHRNLSCVGFDEKHTTQKQRFAAGAVVSELSGVVAVVGDEGSGDWVRVHDGDEGPGDLVADMPDGAGVPSVGDGEREQVRCRKRPVRVAGALPVPCGVHREGVAGEDDGVKRVREDDLDSGCWDTDTGEFMQGGGP